VTQPVCGNEIVEIGEICDDGAMNSDVVANACRTDCRGAYCGDGVGDGDEACDITDLKGLDCLDFGFVNDAGLTCDASCSHDLSGCQAVCGNGVQEPGESCDGTDFAGMTCVDVGGGFTGGTLACDDMCDFDSVACATCGNGLCEPSETTAACPGDCGIVAVAAARMSTCALRADQTVLCWGRNDYGQLGNGVHGVGTESDVPVEVTGLTGVTAISAGEAHYCALLDTGFVYCWGYNQLGELGVGNNSNSDVPVEVTSISGQAAVATGSHHSCALEQSTSASRCWGRGGDGQLGNSSSIDSNNPVIVTGVTDWTAITCGGGSSDGGHCCGLRGNNVPRCWGGNYFGQLGNGESGPGTDEDEPVVINTSLMDWTQISAGGAHTCAIRGSGLLACWGHNSAGQLGLGDQVLRTGPTMVSGVTTAVLVGSGDSHTCVILANATTQCFGSNLYGQLGIGTQGSGTSSLVPVLITGLTGVAALSSGFYHSCVALNDGTVRCWGRNNYGQLGDGTIVDNPNPVQPVGL
jgi:alpha-tubulin suppressor-like RCC1 family protein